MCHQVVVVRLHCGSHRRVPPALFRRSAPSKERRCLLAVAIPSAGRTPQTTTVPPSLHVETANDQGATKWAWRVFTKSSTFSEVHPPTPAAGRDVRGSRAAARAPEEGLRRGAPQPRQPQGAPATRTRGVVRHFFCRVSGVVRHFFCRVSGVLRPSYRISCVF